ncbi:DUF1048 domain-containing protein, partial [Christensenellaceae bacterium OttesenSCG-928-L17]|nr:DUF1048 domain-containing protein [Christensenellaceae bacterium OttesenSCG-928-L17]
MRDFFDNYFNIPKIIKSKREYKHHMARVHALPPDYQYVFEKIQSHMWMFAAGMTFGWRLFGALASARWHGSLPCA